MSHRVLSEKHYKALHDDSGISDEVIEARGYRTVTEARELRNLGFGRNQCITPGLLLPVHTTDGGISLHVYRPDAPRTRSNRRISGPEGSSKVEVIKYELPKNAGIRLDCPPASQPSLADKSIRLWITEGQKKADALASRGLCAIDLLGVWNFKGKNEFGGTSFLADWDHISLDGREICIVFDSDVMLKRQVRKALERLTEHLQRKRAHVKHIYLPAEKGAKTGVDDYLLSHSIADLEALVHQPRPELKPAQATYELIDAAPLMIRKPLTLIDGQSYAALWPYIKKVEIEGEDLDGNIIKYETPKEAIEQRLIIMRSDGVVFGEGGEQSLDKLGMDISLNEVPQPNRLMSGLAIKEYRGGRRADPLDVFKRLVDIVDRFIDFDHSLTDQKTMNEVVACYILSTWFLDAFTVIGFLWPNGERGSGKTQLVAIVAELSYLGQMILAGGSYACLRDMADYGATLCFDDAESLADPSKTDPDKRALLLAGNRRGSFVPVKEQGPDRKWRTRYVSTFCPRAFSAIRLPDPVLASRSIVVPLIRTPDQRRANADPLDYNLWPHDRRRLIDDLWALSLANLPELSHYETVVNERTELTGRNLEPWRAVLAIASWLTDEGIEDLWERISKLSISYQSERQQLEGNDLTVLLIRAICRYQGYDVMTLNDVNDVSWDGDRYIETAAITVTAKSIAQELEADIDPDAITERRIGRTLSKMRFRKTRDSKTRGWLITGLEIRRWLMSLGISQTLGI